LSTILFRGLIPWQKTIKTNSQNWNNGKFSTVQRPFNLERHGRGIIVIVVYQVVKLSNAVVLVHIIFRGTKMTQYRKKPVVIDADIFEQTYEPVVE